MIQHFTPIAALSLVLLTLPVIRSSAGTPLEAQRIIDTATDLELADDPEWLALGHYRQNGAGWKSTIDDSRFFLSPHGKTNPRAELAATIEALFAPQTTNDEHMASRFVARLAWLENRCGLLASSVTHGNDADYRRLLADFKPTTIILGYPAPSASGMSSAFGHVFLSFVRDDRSRLLAPTVSYAALIDETAGFLYPILGLAGGFRGYFTALSHSDKLKEYSLIACRDVWEYELALTTGEVQRIFQHAWEMRGIYSQYYFLDENCAYGVLALLNVGNPLFCPPSFDNRPFILPLDVIRHIHSIGLVRAQHYSPSLLTTMRHNTQSLTASDIAASRAIAYGNRSPDNALLSITNPSTRSVVLSTSMSLAAIRASTGETSATEHQRILKPLIGAAQSLKDFSALQEPPPVPPSPERAHLPSRVTLGAVSYDGSPYWLAGIRPAYHDFLDPSAGMDPAFQLELMGLEIIADDDGHIAAGQVCIVNMEALKPADSLYAPLSHSFDISVEYRNKVQSPNEWNGVVEGGMGFAHALLPRTLVYCMGEMQLQTRSTRNATWIGIGPTAGMVSDLPWGARGYADATYQVGIIEPDQHALDLAVGLSISLSQRMSLACQYSSNQIEDSKTIEDIRAEIRIFF